MASSGAMDMDRPSTPSTPTPKGKEKATGEAQTMKLVLDYLHAHGPDKDSLAMTAIRGMASEEITDVEMTMMRLVLGLTQHVKTLTANVQNLTGIVQDLGKVAKSSKTNDKPKKVEIRQPEMEKKCYAQVAKQTNDTTPETPPKRGRKRKGSAGLTPPQQPQAKTARDNNNNTKSEESPAGWKIAGAARTKNSSPTRRKMFATRSTAKPLADPFKEEAEIAIALANTLTGCACSAPVNLQVNFNKVNGTITVTTPAGTDAGQYMRYAEKMTETLNLAVGTDGSSYMPFRTVPTDVNLMVHGIFYHSVPDNNADLDAKIKKEFMTAYKVNVISAKFLREEPRNKTPEKRATSIIVKIPVADAPRFEPRFVFMGKHKEAKIMWHATPTTQCTRCWKYGHSRVGCKETTDLCPVCSQKHREEDHKCRETACRGYKKLIPGCCNMTPLKSPACEGPHSAKDKECPEKVRVKEEAQRKYDQQMASLADVGNMDTQN